MMAGPASPRAQFNIGMVVEETGVPADTLRVWERRYGLPDPARTEGGHRLYSSQDIATVHWLVSSKQRGISIRHAVDMWREKQAQDRAPASTAPLAGEVEGGALDEARAAWRQACMGFDETRAEGIATRAFALYPPETAVTQILMQGLAELGEAWHENQVSVQQEHFASVLLTRRLHALIAACPEPFQPKTLVAACPPGEEHSLGLLYLAWQLRRQGWPVIYLGENVPQDRLAATLRQIQPAGVLMAASHLPGASALLRVADALQTSGVPLLYGGRAFSEYEELKPFIPGHFLGESLDQAVATLLAHLERGPQMTEASMFPQSNLVLQPAMQARLAAVSLAVSRALSRVPIAVSQIEAANAHWTRNLLASIEFGRMDLLQRELEWVAVLLHHRGVPHQALVVFLQAYQQVAEQHLVGEFQPLFADIQRVVTDYTSAIQ